MPAGIADLLIQQVETFLRYITLTGPSPTYTPIDVSLNTFRGQIRTSPQSVDVVATFTFGFATNGTDGVVLMSLTDLQTSGIPAAGSKYNSLTKYQYDVEMEDPAGNVTRLLNGTASVSPEVTR